MHKLHEKQQKILRLEASLKEKKSALNQIVPRNLLVEDVEALQGMLDTQAAEMGSNESKLEELTDRQRNFFKKGAPAQD